LLGNLFDFHIFNTVGRFEINLIILYYSGRYFGVNDLKKIQKNLIFYKVSKNKTQTQNYSKAMHPHPTINPLLYQLSLIDFL
jgi:hypothetical protein